MIFKKIYRWLASFNYPSYAVFFVTGKCNARCKMCFYKDSMDKSAAGGNELTVEEYEKICGSMKPVSIAGISGGEPFLRNDLSEIVKIIYNHCRPLVLDLPTNGFFTDSVLRQAQDIAKNCPEMIVDLQLSIDGPENVHDEIRGIPGGFARMKETYRRLAAIKKDYPNLRLKACIVYSHYNEKYIEELFNLLSTDFSEFDRIVFSVVHGSVSDKEAASFDWNNYFRLCDKLNMTAGRVKNFDLHSIFTVALRRAKNKFLKHVLKTKDMYKKCGAGKRVIAINETGEVFPCEPLWVSVGNLRECGYDMDKILRSQRMRDFQKSCVEKKCNCHWGLPMSTALLYSPRYYPMIAREMAKLLWH